jgi:hypothetical protein
MFALVAAIATENENYKPYHDIISFRRSGCDCLLYFIQIPTNLKAPDFITSQLVS